MRFSVLHLIFVSIAIIVFIAFIFITWQSKNKQIKMLNNEISELQTKIGNLEEIGNKTLTYVRVNKGLAIIAGRKLSTKQKNILAERLISISTNYKIDPLLILAVIKHESRGNPNAKGAYISGTESGALGLMQIKYESALEVAGSVGVKINSPEDLFNPEINLMVGTAYLLRLVAKYKNLQHALIAYNVGFGTLDDKLKKGATLPKRYYNKVMQEYNLLTQKIFE